jgi:preprotein translocase subunit Sec63
MSGTDYNYDEQGQFFPYFILTVTTLVTVPATISFFRPSKGTRFLLYATCGSDLTRTQSLRILERASTPISRPNMPTLSRDSAGNRSVWRGG